MTIAYDPWGAILMIAVVVVVGSVVTANVVNSDEFEDRAEDIETVPDADAPWYETPGGSLLLVGLGLVPITLAANSVIKRVGGEQS